MSIESVLAALAPTAAELLLQLAEALKAGNKQEAKDLAEEIARRQAFDLLQARKARERKPKP
jgi:dihydrodipicolinate synthase/N-acetylneuraminate lyase